MTDFEGPLYWYWSPNQAVAYNLARAREERGWTQEEAGRRLEPHLGVSWSKATWSQAERSTDPGRSRSFGADEIVAFARCFDLPVAWFFLPPPPGTPGTPTRAETGETAREYAGKLRSLVEQIVGSANQRAEIERRLQDFAGEVTPKSLSETVGIVSEAASLLTLAEAVPAEEVRRWREALQAVAEGLAVIEQAVEGVAGGATVEQEEDFGWVRTVELPGLGNADAERSRDKRRSAEPEIDFGS